uniref:Leucine-rich repeat receptor-like protein kinase n=1 Tax=Pohlia nutans TaxID=140635 RepID=A0A1P8DYX5_9BRYO|nr:leucine-rich repeat receptor-like protein kinase [Pohlia nutans]
MDPRPTERIHCSAGMLKSSCSIWAVVKLSLLRLLPLCAALNSEGLALADFRNKVLDPDRVLRSWNFSDELPCKWRGIVCDNVTNQVIRLNLPRARLSGTISPQLTELLQLRRLGLHFNNLTGAIPSSIGNLQYLRALYLHQNSLTGALPDALGVMPALRILDVSGNKLEHSIPATFANMTNLKFLNLSNNLLSGAVPGGAMLNFSASSFAGNSMLCGSSLLGLPACNQGFQWSIWKIVLLSAAFFILLKIVIGLLLLRRCLRRDRNREIHLGKEGKLVIFKGADDQQGPTSKAMLRAVRKLQKKDIVGEGGYGVVYRMELEDKRVYALKKLKEGLEAALGFENELETLGELKHRNLVKLRGYCVGTTAKLLIYDFIPNGTLDQLLHPRTEEEKKIPVDWATRIKIAFGTARALAYLHHGCRPRIVHRDVSSTNILLAENLEPRLSDFGLARLLGNDDTHVSVTIGGTYGYIAPEYAQTGQATEKSDVYSYGVILLELLSGRKPADPSYSEQHVNLAGWVRSLRETGLQLEAVDMYLRETAPHEEIATAVEIACRCVSLTPDERPPMDKVVQFLEPLGDFESTPSDNFTPSNSVNSLRI